MSANLDFLEEAYRDSIGTVDAQGKRIWAFPKKPKGDLHRKRVIVTIVLLVFFFSAPFIKINGAPFLQINIFERKFFILGQLFLPQDTLVFAIAMVTFFVFIILFTVIYGRIWCGWLCPQTIFMEMVFRKIEYWIDGDRRQQMKLRSMPWNAEKIRKRTLKYFIFALISILIAHLVMSLIVGVPKTIELVTQSPLNNPTGFMALVGFTFLFFFVFTYLREQVCIAICPYGRLQGVLVGRNTMNVIYDYVRGEPRGRLKRGAVQEEQGDCVDCTLCVQVCPTNIDIRNGIQMECVNCTACIDACDDVMDKIGKPRGLIRFGSIESIEENKPFKFSGRALGYTAVLLVLIIAEVFLLAGRSPVEVSVLRVPGQLYQERPDGRLSNLFNAQILNKTQEDMTLTLKLDGKGEVSMVGQQQSITVPAGEKSSIVFFIEMDKADITQRKTDLKVSIMDGEKVLKTNKTTFFGYTE